MRFSRRGRPTAVALALCLGAAGATPGAALACGGLFCGGPPPNPFDPLPVAQNGENVVFAMAKDPAGGATQLTAHIQILYTGDAAAFSWVVPVDAEPKLGVGTDQLFTALAGVTQPLFMSNFEVDGRCLPDPRGLDGAFPPNVATAGGGPKSADAGTADGGAPTVTVLSQGPVGPFDTAVLKSDDPAALKDWLTSNGYAVSDAAARIIDGYVRESKYFVALKLLNGKDTTSIQPIVLKFNANEACVPLRLTAIAANPEMPVRLWVLADHRAIPKNFLELKIDEARIDWLNNGANYNQLVGLAADEAGGNAFVAEYAGSSQIAAGLLWSPGRFDEAALRGAMTPPAYVQLLVSMGLASDTQMVPLLRQYIPMPEAVRAMGVTDAQFYANLASYWAQYQIAADLTGLTEQILLTIIERRRVAQEMIDAHPYLTRLNTFISPDEMNADALFITNPDLPAVSNVHSATFRTMCGNLQYLACNAPVRLELADGSSTWVRAGSTATSCDGAAGLSLDGLASLPAAEMVWQRDPAGEGTVIKDNTSLIRAGLRLNDKAVGMDDGCGCAVGGVPGAGLAGLAMAAAGLALRSRRRRARGCREPRRP